MLRFQLVFVAAIVLLFLPSSVAKDNPPNFGVTGKIARSTVGWSQWESSCYIHGSSLFVIKVGPIDFTTFDRVTAEVSYTQPPSVKPVFSTSKTFDPKRGERRELRFSTGRDGVAVENSGEYCWTAFLLHEHKRFGDERPITLRTLTETLALDQQTVTVPEKERREHNLERPIRDDSEVR